VSEPLEEHRARAHLSFWIRAILDPIPLAVSPPARHASRMERGLALLIDARHAEYQRAAEEYAWPRLGTWPGPDADPGARLIAALGMLLSGSPSASGHLADLAADVTADGSIRTVAGVLAAIAFRDAGYADRAVNLLGSLSPTNSFDEALALIHVALAYREVGDPATALSASLAARGRLTSGERATRVGEALFSVASRNAASFAFTARQLDVFEKLNRPYRSILLFELGSRAYDGLASFVSQEFETKFQDPSTVTMTFRQEDPIQTPLIAARMRAEVLGDWHAAREARAQLGRYQLLASLGVEGRQPASALHLLRGADEPKAIDKAIRSYLFDGPLPPVREFAEAVVVMPWSPITVRSDLTTFGLAADVMRTAPARVAFERIVQNLPSLMQGVPDARLDGEVYRAVAALLPACRADDKWTGDETVAHAFQAVATESHDGLTLQGLTGVLTIIDWRAVTDATREWWEHYCVGHLHIVDDHRFAASALVRALPTTGQLRRAATAAFGQQPDLLTAVNALAVGDLARSNIRKISTLFRSDLLATRLAAREGKHSIGSAVDVPNALVDLLLEHPEQPGWRDLVNFLQEPAIPGTKKARLLDLIVTRRTELPPTVQRRVSAWLARPVQFVDLPLDTPEDIRGAVLRGRLAFRAKTPDDLLGDLAELAANPSRRARHEAARSLQEASTMLPSTVSVTLALSLSRDMAFEVRATAARALAVLAPSPGEPIAGASWRRLVELLADPGSVVAGWVLDGLMASQRRDWPENIVAIVADLAGNHLSRRIRTAADRLLRNQ
jgi:hypothetical protein